MQGVKIVDCSKTYKAMDACGSQEQLINQEIERLNRAGKRIIHVSISQTGSRIPVFACILWEKPDK